MAAPTTPAVAAEAAAAQTPATNGATTRVTSSLDCKEAEATTTATSGVTGSAEASTVGEKEEKSGLREISMEEIKEHNTESSYWCVINGIVYDLTNMLEDHPGGVEVLMDYAGEDATEVFEDVGHSFSARSLAEDFAIGFVKEKVASASLNKGFGASGKVQLPDGAAAAQAIVTGIAEGSKSEEGGTFLKKTGMKSGMQRHFLNEHLAIVVVIVCAAVAVYYILVCL